MTNIERNPRICKVCAHGKVWLLKNMSPPNGNVSTTVEILLRSLCFPPDQIKAEMCEGSEEMGCLQQQEEKTRKEVKE